MKKIKAKDIRFLDSALLNSQTYYDYLERFKKICLSMFEWKNLPDSMSARYLEECLYYKGQAALLKDELYGFINTQVCDDGYLNIYGLPSQLHCFSYRYDSQRNLYTGLEGKELSDAILVMNNWQRTPTAFTIELFCQRLAEAEMTASINIKAQKTPVLIVVDENQRLMMENLYAQYDGNRPFIFGDKNQLSENAIKSINTGANFIADKIMDYKKQIWNEALQFLGVNTLQTEKKERLITDEASSNNELINLNLQSMLIPRQEAAEQFNKLFGLTGDKKVSVRLRSDLYNIIKQEESVITDFNNNGIDDKVEEVDENVE
jgi:Phage Connector (GP10).